MIQWRLTLCKGLRCGVLVAVLRTSLTAQVARTTSTTALSVNTPSLVLPGALRLTSTVNPVPSSPVPTGTINFTYDNGVSLGSSALQTLASSQAFPGAASGSAAITSMTAGQITTPAAIAAFDFYGNGTPVIVAANNGNQNSTVSTFSVFATPSNSTLGQGTTGSVTVSTVSENPIDQIASGLFLDPTKQSLLVHQQSNYHVYYPSSVGTILSGPISTAGLFSQPDVERVSIDDFDGDGYSDVGVLLTNEASAGFAMNDGGAKAGNFLTFSPVPLPTTAPDGTAGKFCSEAIATGKFDPTLNAQLAVLGFFTAEATCPTVPPASTPTYVTLYTAVGRPAVTIAGNPTTGTYNLTIASTLAGATIYYTTDGTTPTTADTVCSGPVQSPLPANGGEVIVNAIAVSPSGVETLIGTATYFQAAVTSPVVHPRRSRVMDKIQPIRTSHAQTTGKNVLPRVSNAPVLRAVGTGQTLLAAADFNHDGKLDLLAGSGPNNNVQVFSGDGAGNFQAATTIATPVGPSLLSVNDFNGDGYPDVAIQVTGGFAVALNDGKGNLQTPTQPYASGTLQALCSIDFNADGLADLALFEPASGTAPDGTVQSLLSSASAQAIFTTLPQTLPAGNHTLTAAYAGDNNFAPSTSTPLSETVTQTVPVLSWAVPSPIAFSSPPPTLGAQLDATAAVAGAALPGVFAYSPAAGTSLTLGANPLTVAFTPTDSFDYASATAAVTQQVNLPPASATDSISTANSSGGAQPAINLTLGSFPEPLEVAISLGFTDSSAAPAANNGSLVFIAPASPFADEVITASSAGTVATDKFTVPANSPAGELQRIFSAGTVAGGVTVTITIKYNGTEITPSSLAPLPLPVPASVPILDTATYSVSGSTLTVVVNASSTTREISGAAFHFTPASGQSLKTTDVNFPSPTEFSQWFTGQSSAASGGSFTYTQTFSLSSANALGGVTVTLQNGQGESAPITAQSSD
jgi:hypothetical protein